MSIIFQFGTPVKAGVNLRAILFCSRSLILFFFVKKTRLNANSKCSENSYIVLEARLQEVFLVKIISNKRHDKKNKIKEKSN
jgi:hypothetical protein